MAVTQTIPDAERIVKGFTRQPEFLIAMMGVLAALQVHSPDEYAEFLAWDEARPGNVGTSTWPGFERYIGPKP